MNILQFLKNSWRGNSELWRVYWLVYFPISLINRTIEKFYFHDEAFTQSQAIACLIFYVWWIGVTIWCVVAIWRCAYNVKSKGWGHVARFICILNILFIAAALIEFIKIFL